MSLTNPKFRPDIRQHPFEEKDGSRSIVLEDPVANKYFRISPYELELLNVLDGNLTLDEAIERLKFRGRHFTRRHAAKLVEQFARAGLLLGTAYSSSKHQQALSGRMLEEQRKRSLFKLYYLYIPVLNPDRLLEKTFWLWRLLVNRLTTTLFFLLIPGAIYLLISGASRLSNEFLFFFNFENMLVLWIAIASAKLVHELSHAYTAKGFGLRVPEMGIAFLLFFPCLYCNTTAAWELADRRQRMLIALAGILAEVVLGVIAVYVWYFTKPGLVNSVAFWLVAVSLTSSVLFNGNPLLKFDGYFILTDALQMPNLQAKAINQIRYLFFHKVLGIESVEPVRASSGERLFFTMYGVSAFVYRFFLYASIIAGVYLRFDKTIGLVLAGTALTLFVVRPLMRGSIGLVKRTSEMRFRPLGLAVFAVILAAVVFLLTRPWSSNSVYPCYLESAELQQIAIPAEAPVAEVNVRLGDAVKAGQIVLKLDSTALEFKLKDKTARKAYVKREIAMIRSSEKDLSKLPMKLIELAQEEDAIAHIEEDLKNIVWRAPYSGYVTKLLPTLQPGANPGKGAVVGELSGAEPSRVLGLVPEVYATMIREGSEVKAWFPVDEGKEFPAVVKEVSPFKTEDLQGSPLSSRFGGEIATEIERREGGVMDAPLEPYYLCKADIAEPRGLFLGMTGRLVVGQSPRSALQRIIDAAYQTFHREIIF